jgi:hypothetical protein
MDPEKRIEELELELAELRGLVRELVEAHRPAPPPAPWTPMDTAGAQAHEAGLIHEMRERVDRVLKGDSEESIEAHIGAVWLSRLAVVVMMTAFALAARATFQTVDLGVAEKVALGYATGAVFLLYGLRFRRERDLFADAMAGCGLASLYFTTYAAFFVPPMQAAVLAGSYWALPAMLACLGLLAGVAQWRKSPTIAGIGLFLAYYTVLVSATGGGALNEMAYALLTCTALAAVTLGFHLFNQWVAFSWAALLATYTAFHFFLYRSPPGLEVSAAAHFWVSAGFLALCYVIFSLGFIIDAHRRQEFRRRVAPMSGVNSFLYAAMMWFAIRGAYPDQEWMFRTGFALLLAWLAFLTRLAGPRGNYLYQVFAAKAVIMLTLALTAYLSGEKLLAVLAVESLALGVSYRRSGIVVFKALGFALMLGTALGAMFSARAEGTMDVAGFSMPANWFAAISVAAVFTVAACFYENFARGVPMRERTFRGQWLLAGSFLDLSANAMAMAYAACAALVLLTITAFSYNEDPALPYLLAGEGVALAVAGFVLRTRQVDAAAVLLLAPAHVAYYLFVYMPLPGFTEQPLYTTLTVALALFTFAGAFLWERYLQGLAEEVNWEHHVTAALPYLAGAFMLFVLIVQQMPPVQTPPAAGALGAALLLAGVLAGYPGVKAAGLLALGLATIWFHGHLHDPSEPLHAMPGFLPYTTAYLLTFAVAERAFVRLQHRGPVHFRLGGHARTLLTGVALATAVAALFQWRSGHELILGLLVVALVSMALGLVFRESRYRWGALFVFGVATLRAFLYLGQLEPALQVVTFGAAGLALLGVSWGYARWRRRQLAGAERDRGRGRP